MPGESVWMMKVINNIDEIQGNYQHGVIALGTFDGIHLGHQDIIASAVNYAHEKKITPILFTFQNHPLLELAPNKVPMRLMSCEQKIDLISKLNIDVLLAIDFNNNMANMSSEEFVISLIESLAPTAIVVGDNFTYGAGGVGNTKTLRVSCEKNNIKLIVRNLISIDNTVVSSTNIRNYIDEGELIKAAEFLGRKYSVCGKIVHGKKLGHTIGFPTANIEVEEGIAMPADGGYAVQIKIKDQIYNAMASYGKNPTVENKNSSSLEVNIFDFDADIYDEYVEVFFYKKTRNIEKFASLEHLIAAINHDKDLIEKFFASYSASI